MLVLTRDIGTSIVIGDNITITLLEVRGNQARFGIDAPREIPVNRQEIHDKIQMEKMKNEKMENKLVKIKDKCVICNAPATCTADLLLEDDFNFHDGWSVDLKQKINFCEEHSKRTVPYLIVNNHNSSVCEQL